MGDLENTIGFSHMDYFLGERATKESERDPPRVTREAPFWYQQLAASARVRKLQCSTGTNLLAPEKKDG